MEWSFIALADVHMSNSLPGAKPSENGRTNRLDDQLKLWDQVYKAAEEHDVDNILVLGDLFDKSKVDPVTLTHTVEAIMKTNREMLILPGNHDANSVTGGRFAVEAFREMSNEMVTVIGEKPGDFFEMELGSGRVSVWPLAFSPVSKTVEQLEMIRDRMSDGDFNVLLLHNSIMGAHHLGWECDDGLDPRKTCSGFDMVLAGHFHESQMLDNGKWTSRRYQYLGAPMHHDFRDVGRSASIWHYKIKFVEKRKNWEVEATEIPTSLPRYHVCELDSKVDVPPGDYVRIIVSSTHAEWKMKKSVVEELVKEYEEKGINASYLHKPIYHHKSRLGKTSGERLDYSMESAIANYVEQSDVDTEGLDVEKLKKLGMEALSAVRMEHGIT